MFLIEVLWPLLHLDKVVGKTRLFSESVLQSLHETMTNSSCGSSELELCRDESAAFVLKFVAMASILIAGMSGIGIPLVGKHRTDGNLFIGAKAFAAGVILATGFVHMLNDSSEALKDPCLESYAWSKFPFSGFFAMMSALLTLLVDFMATQYYERKWRNKVSEVVDINVDDDDDGYEPLLESEGETGIVAIVEVKERVVIGEEERGGMHIVGMHAHQHGHDGVKEHSHGHSHAIGGSDDEESSVRHVIVSQDPTVFERSTARTSDSC